MSPMLKKPKTKRSAMNNTEKYYRCQCCSSTQHYLKKGAIYRLTCFHCGFEQEISAYRVALFEVENVVKWGFPFFTIPIKFWIATEP